MDVDEGLLSFEWDVGKKGSSIMVKMEREINPSSSRRRKEWKEGTLFASFHSEVSPMSFIRNPTYEHQTWSRRKDQRHPNPAAHASAIHAFLGPNDAHVSPSRWERTRSWRGGAAGCGWRRLKCSPWGARGGKGRDPGNRERKTSDEPWVHRYAMTSGGNLPHRV